MRFSAADFKAYLARRAAAKGHAAGHLGEPVEREKDLHDAIIAECKGRGWMIFHGSMAHRTFRTPGEPDFHILCEDGRRFMVECKAKGGKLSKDQQAIMAWARKLGHEIYEVSNLAEFLFRCDPPKDDLATINRKTT